MLAPGRGVDLDRLVFHCMVPCCRMIAAMIFSCAGVRRRHLVDQAAFVHDIEPVADAEQFGHFRGDHDHAFAGCGQLVDDGVDLVFGADVDAAGRLVEDQHLRIGEQPFAQHHLLLVAAGQIQRLLQDAGGADVEFGAVLLGDDRLSLRSSITPARDTPDRCASVMLLLMSSPRISPRLLRSSVT